MDLYYVYSHRDPRDQTIVYVGMGKDCRAWNTRKGNRSKDHITFLHSMYSLGYTLADIVTIEAKDNDKVRILDMERELITSHRPVFNKLSNPEHHHKYRMLSEEACDFIHKLRSMGYSYSNIAYLTGGNNNKTMSIWRATQYAT